MKRVIVREGQRSRAPVPLVRAGQIALGVGVSAICLERYARVEWPWPILGWVLFVPWFLALERCRHWRGALLASAAFTVAFTWAALAWFAESIAAYTGASAVGAALALSLGGAILEPQLLVTGLAYWATSEKGSGRVPPLLVRVTCVCAAYVGTELLWPKLLADTIGQGLLAAPYWVQAADLFGAHGLTFVLVAANVLVADAVAAIRAHLRSEWSGGLTRVVAALATVTVLVVALSAYGVAQWKRWQPQSPAQRIVVGVVQGNLSQYDRLRAELGSFGAVREILDRYMGLTRAVAPRGADFWAWPETMYPTTFGSPKSEAGRDFDHEILEFARGLQRPLAFGAYDRDAAGEYNAAFFVRESEDSRTHVEVYRKAMPFPLTEWVPEWLEVLGLRERLRWLGSWKKGAGPAVVDLPLRSGRTVRVQPLICYDAVWPQLSASGARNGAELLLVFSNDSWFPSRQGRWLHLVASAFRSLETRRPQVRVTPTGFTAVVNARGEVAVLVPPDQPGAATVAVGLPGAGSLPLAARLGSWDLFAYLAVFPALLGVTLWRFANNARTVQSRVRKRNDAQEKIRD